MPNLNIVTTQNVNLFFTTASLGDRMLGFIIDAFVKIAYLFIIMLLINNVEVLNDAYTEGGAGYLIVFVLFSPVLFYTLASESLMEGQTIGKKIVKAKVVKIDGYQAGFFEYLVRWIFTIIDIYLLCVPGVISMVLTRNTLRIGDLAAGTAVISEKSKHNISQTILMEVEDEYVHYFNQNQILLFRDNDIRIIKENFDLALSQRKPEIISHLARKIEQVLNIKSQFSKDKELIETVLKDYNYFTGR